MIKYECGVGWYNIINECIDKLNNLKIPGFKVLQVKEKFGSLRIYVVGTNNNVEAIINEATDRCKKTCESCGSEENVEMRYSSAGWMKNLCSNCTINDFK